MSDPETTVRRQVTVPVPPERAYALFVESFDLIKPREHNPLATAVVETVLEPHPGGRLLDRGADGSILVWGLVREVRPPHLLRFDWLLGPDFRPVLDPANVSQVTVGFTEAGAGATEVSIEHRHLDRHGPGWEAIHRGVAGPAGWRLYLDRYAALATGHPDSRGAS